MSWALSTVGKMILVLLVLVILSYVLITHLGDGSRRIASCELNGGICRESCDADKRIYFNRDETTDAFSAACTVNTASGSSTGFCCSRI